MGVNITQFLLTVCAMMNSCLFSRLFFLLLLGLSLNVESREILYTIKGDEAGSFLGRSVSAAGDVNADGYADVIIGARAQQAVVYGQGGNGSVRIYSGKNRKLLYKFKADMRESEFGTSVSGAGDVNGDGHADVIITGGYLDESLNVLTGFARVYSGMDGAILYNFDSENNSQQGVASGAGDVNGDGYADVVVSYPSADSLTLTQTGMVRIYSGKSGEILYTFYGEQSFEDFGGSLDYAGDVNGDGYADVIIGSTYSDNDGFQDNGRANVFSGKDGGLLYTFDGIDSYVHFGSSVSGLGDVNRDGYADVIVAAENENDHAGSVRVFSGADGGLLYDLKGNDTDFLFGIDVSGAGDVNADGFADFVVSDLHQYASGHVRVFSGKDGNVLKEWYGAEEEYFGISVCGAGDVNRDGYADIVVGAFRADNKNLMWAGKAFVFSGKPKKPNTNN